MKLYGNFLGWIGYFLQGSGKEEKALNYYKKGIEHNMTNAYALTAYGLKLLKDYNFEEALSLFIKAMNSKSATALIKKHLKNNIALCNWKLGNLDKAIEQMEKMLEEYEILGSDFFTTLGFLYIEKGDDEKALNYTNKIFETDPSHGPAFDNLGQLYYRKKDYDKAKEYFLKAIEDRPTMSDSNFYLGKIYEIENELDSAKKYYEKAGEGVINGLTTIKKEDVENALLEIEKK